MRRHAPAGGRTIVVVAIFVATLSGSLLGAAPAGACSCAPVTDADAFATADAAFIGVLVETIPPPTRDVMSSADPERFVFEVDEVFKGEVTVTQSVVTPAGGESCGLEIVGRGPFLVFASETSGLTSGARDGELYSHLCSGTRPLTDGEPPSGLPIGAPPTDGEVADVPDPPAAPIADGDPSDGEGDAASSALSWLGVGVVVAAASLGWRFLRRHRQSQVE